MRLFVLSLKSEQLDRRHCPSPAHNVQQAFLRSEELVDRLSGSFSSILTLHSARDLDPLAAVALDPQAAPSAAALIHHVAARAAATTIARTTAGLAHQ